MLGWRMVDGIHARFAWNHEVLATQRGNVYQNADWFSSYSVVAGFSVREKSRNIV